MKGMEGFRTTDDLTVTGAGVVQLKLFGDPEDGATSVEYLVSAMASNFDPVPGVNL